MFDFFENLSVRMQFLVLAGVLALLFLLVRWNTKRNRNKRQQYQNFAERLKERRKEREKEGENEQ